MKYERILILIFLGAITLHVGCNAVPQVHTVPITGRKTILSYAEPDEISMGLSAFEELTAKAPTSQNQHYVEMVNRVGKRIAAVAERDDYEWEFRVLATPEQNAFCLPGGKVAVHEGILPICESESGLAVVMAHEIAHALARHGGERMTHHEVADTAKNFLGQYMQQHEPLTQELVMNAYGLGKEYGFIRPYSRKHESEADHMGLILMARAGYDPTEAPRFWQRFATMNQGKKQPEFLSTHPSDERRAADLLELLPAAQDEFLAAETKFGRGEMIALAPLPSMPVAQSATPPPSQSFNPYQPNAANQPVGPAIGTSLPQQQPTGQFRFSSTGDSPPTR